MSAEDKTTLPDRLRKLAAGWVTTYPHARDTVAAMNEAADEIERLNKLIEDERCASAELEWAANANRS